MVFSQNLKTKAEGHSIHCSNDYMCLRINVRSLAIIISILLVIFFVIYSIFQPPNVEFTGNGFYVFYTREEFVPELISDDNQALYYLHEPTVALSDDFRISTRGENSLKIVLSKTPAGISVAYRDFIPVADWSSKDSISFFWYGAKSYSTFNLIIECTGGYYRKQINDNWTGWKQLLIAFKDMEKFDYADLSQVKRLCFQLATGSSLDVVWRLDHVILETIGDDDVFYNVTFGGQVYIKNHGNELNRVTLKNSFIDYTGAEVPVSSELVPSVPSGRSLLNFNFTMKLSGQDAPPQMVHYMTILRLFTESGLEIDETRADIPAFPSVPVKEFLEP